MPKKFPPFTDEELDDAYDLTEEDLGQERDPRVAIPAMERRIGLLVERIEKLRVESPTPERAEDLSTLNSQLSTTQQRLADYRHLHERRN